MFSSDPSAAGAIEGLAHLIQTALTPVFLLSGIASLLSVFSARLARVADRCHYLTAALEAASAQTRDHVEAELGFLQMRSRVLDVAVLLGTAGGGATCAAAQLMFIGALRTSAVASLLYISFALALVFTTLALIAFMIEVLLASRGLREQQRAMVRGLQRQRAAEAEPIPESGEAMPP